jgi:prepilin-type processing-associated H-X9-DG protein
VPNALINDCALNGWRSDSLGNRTTIEGVITARSRHPGGVNTLRMDGSVHFATNGINLAVWRALSTRSGGEAIPESL